jgi:prevent-host-death family protein
MPGTSIRGENNTVVISALRVRANFGKLLNRVEDDRQSLIIEKRGTPRAVLPRIRDYVKLAAPEPEGLLSNRRRMGAEWSQGPHVTPDQSDHQVGQGKKEEAINAFAAPGDRYECVGLGSFETGGIAAHGSIGGHLKASAPLCFSGHFGRVSRSVVAPRVEDSQKTSAAIAAANQAP